VTPPRNTFDTHGCCDTPVPLTHPLAARLTALHARLAPVTDGQVADYIPALAKADPAMFALSLVTVEGRDYDAGSVSDEVTIQSVSKPFVYALALADSGLDTVLSRVGTEPTGDAFNAVTLEAGTGRPLNPMVNAGAIESACLVSGSTVEQKTRRIVDGLSAFAGRSLEIDDDVYRSEAQTGDRNRALAYLMQGAGALSLPVEDALAVYFAQCSIRVTSNDLAVMAATLASGGANPKTGERVVPPSVVGPTLSVMATCGMYDAAGTWLFRVGLPAKSGVSGGVLAVLPGQFGLGVFSPPLDPQGNSVRGVLAAQELSHDLGLHLFTPVGASASPIRRWTNGLAARSVAARSTDHAAVLDSEAHRIQVLELQGSLHDLAVESLTHRLLEAAEADADGAHWSLVLDLSHVSSVHRQAVSVLDDALDDLASAGATVAVVDPVAARPRSEARVGGNRVEQYTDLDQALAAVEDRILVRHGRTGGLPDAATPTEEHEVLGVLSPSHREILASRLVSKVVPAGTIVLEAGSPPDGLVWISTGEASVLVRTPRGRWRRVSGVGAGGVLGEMSMVDQRPRSARVVTETPALLRLLDAEAVRALRDEHREVYEAVVLALAQLLSGRLRRSTAALRSRED
jgi:glutaminase